MVLGGYILTQVLVTSRTMQCSKVVLMGENVHFVCAVLNEVNVKKAKIIINKITHSV